MAHFIETKDYPQPNPSVKGSSTRFSKGFEGDKDGKKTAKEIIAKAEFEYNALGEFIYDADNIEGSFKKTDKKENDVVPPYIPSPDLVELVRLMQILQRPALMKGEPGSGKTQLAKALAYEWYGDNYRNHYFEWHIKSTSKATDGLYEYDHVARLRDGQMKKIKDRTEYRRFGPLAKAFLTARENAPSILLIDEIDKADIDFPNDLLLELDEKRFLIPETEELIRAKHPVLIFITSNDERELPEAFLRRCLFMYIKFPDAQLLNIIEAHLPYLIKEQANFTNFAIERFKKLRDKQGRDAADNKRISTSELLDMLKAYQNDIAAGRLLPDTLTENSLETLPYYQTVLKTLPAYKREKEQTDKK